MATTLELGLLMSHVEAIVSGLKSFGWNVPDDVVAFGGTGCSLTIGCQEFVVAADDDEIECGVYENAIDLIGYVDVNRLNAFEIHSAVLSGRIVKL